jgi:hypothetical protein
MCVKQGGEKKRKGWYVQPLSDRDTQGYRRKLVGWMKTWLQQFLHGWMIGWIFRLVGWLLRWQARQPNHWFVSWLDGSLHVNNLILAPSPQFVYKLYILSCFTTCFGSLYASSGKILYRVQPLLCDDREIGEYTEDFTRQRLAKHVPPTTNRPSTIEVLLETGCFYVVRADELSWR